MRRDPDEVFSHPTHSPTSDTPQATSALHLEALVNRAEEGHLLPEKRDHLLQEITHSTEAVRTVPQNEE